MTHDYGIWWRTEDILKLAFLIDRQNCTLANAYTGSNAQGTQALRGFQVGTVT